MLRVGKGGRVAFGARALISCGLLPVAAIFGAPGSAAAQPVPPPPPPTREEVTRPEPRPVEPPRTRLEVVVDRLRIDGDLRSRLTDSIETSYREGGGAVFEITLPARQPQERVAAEVRSA